jgi:hypothetical protein
MALSTYRTTKENITTPSSELTSGTVESVIGHIQCSTDARTIRLVRLFHDSAARHPNPNPNPKNERPLFGNFTSVSGRFR